MNPAGKITAVVAGMLTGADSIDDLDVIRHGGTRRLFTGAYAPSSLGSHLRAYSHGHARQLESAARAFLPALVARTPVLSGIEQACFVDIDDTRKRVFGHAKQGAGFNQVKIGGYRAKLRNLDALVGTVSTPTSPPMIATTRLRGGRAGSARGAASFVTETLGTAGECGADPDSGLVLLRADSSFYNSHVIAACQDKGVRFSITVPMNPSIKAAIATIEGEQAWTAIRYPEAIWDEQLRCWISDAQITQTTYTAFASTSRPVPARLIVRRVKDKNVSAEQAGQGELFTAWRYHAVFTDNPMPLVQAETAHRGHAIVEQVFADLNDGPLAHLPSGVFAANAAWVTCAALCHNLLRATGALASVFHARARGATVRRHLINLPGRIARSARRLRLHLPTNWPWQDAAQALFAAANAPPAAA